MSLLSLSLYIVLSIIIGIATKAARPAILKVLGAGAVFLALAFAGGVMVGYGSDEVAAMFRFSLGPEQDRFGLGSSVVIGYSFLTGGCIALVRYITRRPELG